MNAVILYQQKNGNDWTEQSVADDADRRLDGGGLPYGVNSPITFTNHVAVNGRISLYCLWDPPVAFADDSSPANKITEVMREGHSYAADRGAPPPSPCRPPTAAN